MARAAFEQGIAQYILFSLVVGWYLLDLAMLLPDWLDAYFSLKQNLELGIRDLQGFCLLGLSLDWFGAIGSGELPFLAKLGCPDF